MSLLRCLIAALVALSALAVALPAQAQFVLVAHTSKAGSSNPVTTAIDTTGATLIVVTVTGSNTSPSLADSKSNTWTRIELQNSGANATSAMYYAVSPTVGAGHTFTATETFSMIFVQAWSGNSLVSPLDQHTSHTSPSGSTFQPGSITPLQPNELVLSSGFCGNTTGGGIPSVNSGMTAVDGLAGAGGSNYGGGAMAYIVQTSAVAINPTWTCVGSVVGSTIIASFKAPGSAFVPNVPSFLFGPFGENGRDLRRLAAQ